MSLRLAAMFFCVGMAACASRPITLQTGPRSLTPDDYFDVYEAWTRTDDDFEWSEFEDVLHVSATFESWEFRWAYVVRYAADHSLEGDTRNELLRATLTDARQNHRFFVTLAGPVFREQDLSSPRSAWRIVMVDLDGRQVEPIEIEQVRRPTAAERVYFPSISSFRQTFRIVFPVTHPDGSPTIDPNTPTAILRFAGARGQVDLRWEFSPADRE